MENISTITDAFEDLFPFHFIIDRSLYIRKAGKGLLKLFPKIALAPLSSTFNFKRPDHVLHEFESIKTHCRQIFILESLEAKRFLFRGQMIYMEKTDDLLFIGTPWITNVEDIESYNLLIADYALHDISVDMLHMLKTKEVIMNDFKRVAVDLKRQKEELVKAQAAAEQSHKTKERFLANMSHEIRTPMNGIIGMTEILCNSNLNDDQKECIDAIKQSADNLMGIINVVLDFSKIDAGKVTFDKNRFSLEDLFLEVSKTLHFAYSSKNLVLDYTVSNNIPNILVGDSARLRQILLNLTGNAIKFTERGRVDISVDLLNINEEECEIGFSVSDTGIGIPDNMLDRIFESFTQVNDSTTRKHGGTGLGLSIAKQLVELQGGTISVSSVVNTGSVFRFSMKFGIGKGELVRAEARKVVKADLNALKILLVEDNLINQMLAKRVLAEWNVVVDTAENGRIAINKLAKEQYDLILMDIQMPEMDGYETTLYIRQQFDTSASKIPIIAMTAHAMAGEIDKCLAAGMNDYISKPFSQWVLYEKIINNTASKKNIDSYQESNENIETQPLNSKRHQYIDLQYLKSMSNGSPEFIKDMINIFLEETPLMLNQMNEYMQAKDLEGVRKAVHKMKASMDLMGIKSIREDIINIEQSVKNKTKLDLLPNMVEKVEDDCLKALEELKTELV